MSSIAGEFYLANTNDACLKLADRVSGDYGHEFPAPVRKMVQDRADLDYGSWDYEHDCDALTVGLETARPKVFLRESLTYEPRVRFTLAHELGHLVIPWHTGIQGCVPNASAGGSFNQEQQANSFAGALLLPRSVVAQTLQEVGLAKAFTYLAGAGMSASAFVLSLSRYLLPGFFLVSERGGPNPAMRVWTKGSVNYRITSQADAEARSFQHGVVAVAGKNVHWYRFVEQHTMPSDDDDRTTSDILRSAIEQADPGIDRVAMFKSINGIVGGKLSTVRAVTPETIYATLVHVTEGDRRIPPEVRRSTDFSRFLSRKAQERSAKLLSGGASR